MGWNHLSIPKRQRSYRWRLGIDKWFHPTLYLSCDYLFIQGLKSNHVSKRDPMCIYDPNLAHHAAKMISGYKIRNLNLIENAWNHRINKRPLDFSFDSFLNTLRPRQNGRHFSDDSFKCIFLNENVSIAIKISLKFVPKGPINNIPALVQIMAWRRPGDKPISEPMMVSLPTHICVTRSQCVKVVWDLIFSVVIPKNYAKLQRHLIRERTEVW